MLSFSKNTSSRKLGIVECLLFSPSEALWCIAMLGWLRWLWYCFHGLRFRASVFAVASIQPFGNAPLPKEECPCSLSLSFESSVGYRNT